MKCVLCLVVLAIGATRTFGQTHEDAKQLTDHLFYGYDKRIRPTRNQSLPIEVLVDFTLLTINELDEVSETMKVSGYLRVSWVDDYLVWNPDHFGGLQYYLWPQSTIWKPDVSLGNSVFEYNELGVDTLNVEVSFDGTVLWHPFEVFQSTCTFDITYFPFDVQTCSLDFIALSYTQLEVTMKGGSLGIDLREYIPSSTWKLLGTKWSIEDNHGESSIRYQLTVKRKPLFFFLTVIMPIILLAFLNLFVFLLPCESGERAGFSVTVFLAFAVFLTIVSDSLPRNSENVSVFAIYMVILTIQSTIITIIAMITIRWSHNTTNNAIPGYMLTMARIVRCKVNNKVAEDQVSTRRRCSSTEKQDNRCYSHTESITGYTSTPVEMFQDAVGETGLDTNPLGDKNQTHTWVEIVRALDIMFFIIFFLILSITTVVCFVVTSTTFQ